MNKFRELQKRAQKRYRLLKKQRRDPRYLNVIGRLVHEGLLDGGGVIPSRARATIDDALWAAEIEPRICELLPAIVFRHPRMFLQTRPLPDDLDLVVVELRRGRAETAFRGVAAKKYMQWVTHVGRNKAKRPAIAKTHRFNDEDLARIEELKKRWGVGETEVLRRALMVVVGTPLSDGKFTSERTE